MTDKELVREAKIVTIDKCMQIVEEVKTTVNKMLEGHLEKNHKLSIAAFDVYVYLDKVSATINKHRNSL